VSANSVCMTNIFTAISDLPPEQRAIRDKCFYPLENLVEITNEGIKQSIPHSFEQQVARNPDRVAVKTKNHSFTYDQLNKAANRVANAILAQCGKGQESVGLLFEQDALLVAKILGVLKTGKCFVILDLSYPRERIDFIVNDSQIGLILTNSGYIPLGEKLALRDCQLLNAFIHNPDKILQWMETFVPDGPLLRWKIRNSSENIGHMLLADTKACTYLILG